jgi:hypothetical protein
MICIIIVAWPESALSCAENEIPADRGKSAGTPELSASGEDSRANGISVAAGVPYTLGFAYRRDLNSRFSLQIHAGSAVIFSSAGARLSWSLRKGRFAPYIFAGGAAVHSRAGKYGDPEGISNYLWFGPGANFKRGRIEIFAEACALIGGDDDKGIGDDWYFPFNPAIGGGIMFRF